MDDSYTLAAAKYVELEKTEKTANVYLAISIATRARAPLLLEPGAVMLRPLDLYRRQQGVRRDPGVDVQVPPAQAGPIVPASHARPGARRRYRDRPQSCLQPRIGLVRPMPTPVPYLF